MNRLKIFGTYRLSGVIGLLIGLLPLCAQDSLAIADLNQAISKSYRQIRSQPDSAIIGFQEHIAQARLLSAGVQYAKAYNGLVQTLFRREQDFDQANAFSKEAIDSIPRLLSTQSPYFADALSNRSVFLKRLGQMELALSYQKRALEINLLSEQPSWYIISALYQGMGSSYAAQGDWLEAIRHYEKALSTRQKDSVFSDAYYRHLGISWSGLGWANLQMNQIEASRSAYQQIEHHTQKSRRVDAALGLAEGFARENQKDSALIYLTKAEVENQQEPRHKPQRIKEIQATLFQHSGQGRLALRAFLEAQSLRKEYTKARFRDLSRGARQIGEQYHQLGQMDSAALYFEKALQYLSSPGENPSGRILFEQSAIPVLTARAHMKLSQHHTNQDQNRLLEGLQDCEYAWQLFANLRETRPDQAQQLALNLDMQRLYEQAFEILYLLHEQNPDHSYGVQAMVWMEYYHRGILYKERLRNQKWQEISPELKRQEEDFRLQISQLQASLQKIKDQGKRDRLNEQLAELQEAYRTFRKKLAREWAIFELEAPLSNHSLEDIFQKIPSNTASISYFWGDEQVFRLLYSNGQITFQKIYFSEADTEKILAFVKQIKQVDYQENSLLKFRQKAFELYEKWMPAFSDPWPEPLVLIADGPLAYLPFEALVTESEAGHDFRSMAYLIRKTDIHYAHALSLLYWPTSQRARKRELAVFAPDYPGNLAIPQNANLPAQLLSQVPGRDFSQHQPNLKQAFIQAIPRYEMLHLALHGMDDSNQNGQACLLFPPENQAEIRLFQNEIYNLHFPHNLISLSACEVGAGRLELGEGLMSLNRAFRYAGAATVLSSRWEADARAADILFPLFYQSLHKGTASARAFSQAKKEYLKQAPPDLVHPFYWAGFAHWGENIQANSPRKKFLWMMVLLAFAIPGLIYFRKLFR